MENKPRMLICEDVAQTAKELELLFEAQYQVRVGYNVKMCTDLLQTERQMLDPQDRYAVAIVDLSFNGGLVPNTMGYKILEEVRNDPFLEPVVFTGLKHVENAIESHELGAFRYVIKSREAMDGQPIPEGSIAKLVKAVTEATECWRRLVQLDAALARLTNAHADDQDILPHARFVFEYIQRIRGRYRE